MTCSRHGCAALLLLLLAVARATPAAAQPQPRSTPDAGVPDAGPGPVIEGEGDSDEAAGAGDGDNDTGTGDGTDEAGTDEGTNGPAPSEGPRPDLLEVQPPPERWSTFEVVGELLEPAETIEAFLEPRMERARALNDAAQEELRDFLRNQLGYELVQIRRDRGTDGALHAVLELRPLLVVYRVNVTVDNLPRHWWYPWRIGRTSRAFFESVFSDQVRRRMRLRQGKSLPYDERAQERALSDERARILEYLRNEGFFDAQVRLHARPWGKRSVVIDVEIHKGDRYQIGDIDVVGATALSADEIRKQFKHAWFCLAVFCFSKGGFSREQLNKDVQKVLSTYHRRGYPGARVRTDFDSRHSFHRDSKTVQFTVFVNERRKIDVVFIGNDKKKNPDDQLQQQLTFADEGSYDDLEIRASAEAIRRYYQSRGRFEASVAWERDRFEGVFERIVFTIDEGPRLPVRDVAFEGNHAVAENTLRSLVATKEYRDVALFGGGGGFVTSLQLQQDVARIADLYRKRGYSKVKVRARVARDRRVQANAAALAAAVAGQIKAEGLYVRFIIDEGPQQSIGEVSFRFTGEAERLDKLAGEPDKLDRARRYYARRESRLRKLIGLNAGSPFDPARLSKDRSALTRFYFQEGYPHAYIREIPVPRGEKAAACPNHDEGDSQPVTAEQLPPDKPIDIIWCVTEHDAASFGKVIVRGNFHTHRWVIRDELGFDEGDDMTLERAERAQQNLRTTGLFKTVSVKYPEIEDDTQDTLNVLVNVQERERITLELAGGYSTDTGWFGEASLAHRNWLGMGLRPELRAHYGDQLKFADAKLLLPRWIGRRLSLGAVPFTTEVAAFARREARVRFGNLDSFGTSLALSRTGQYGFFQGWIFQLRYDLRLRFRTVNLVRPAGASDDLTNGPVPTITGSAGPQVIIDKRTDRDGRPNPLLPERGWLLELHAAYADPVLSAPVRLIGTSPGRDRFIKLGGSGQWFKKLSKRTLFTAFVRYDHGVPLGSEFLLPEVERFFAGGDTTVRGFEEDRLATEIIEDGLPPIGEVKQLRILPAGGNIRFVGNFDLQMEVWKLLGFPVTSALFTDVGLVTNSLDGFKVTDLRHSVGVALFRWTLPVGSLSFEYAVPLDPEIGDNPRGRFHFNLGLLF